jgi:hypothetical protein
MASRVTEIRIYSKRSFQTGTRAHRRHRGTASLVIFVSMSHYIEPSQTLGGRAPSCTQISGTYNRGNRHSLKSGTIQNMRGPGAACQNFTAHWSHEAHDGSYESSYSRLTLENIKFDKRYPKNPYLYPFNQGHTPTVCAESVQKNPRIWPPKISESAPKKSKI